MDETTEAAGLEGGGSTTEVDVACGNHGQFCEALARWTGDTALAETISWALGTPIKIALIVIVALIVNRLARRLIARSMERIGHVTADSSTKVVSSRTSHRAEERAATISSLLRSSATAAISIIAVLMVFDVLGFSLVPVIASAGILGIAVGFGAQSIIEDFLTGIFFLTEDQFGKGDRVDVGFVSGTLERVTLRTAVIRDPEGTIWHVPNSEIRRVANESQVRSRATVEIGVSYDTDLRECMTTLGQAAIAAAEDPEWAPSVKDEPEVVGVQELGDDAVSIRVVTWVEHEKRRSFERYLRLRLKEALDAADVEMPNRQLDVWLRGQPAGVAGA